MRVRRAADLAGGVAVLRELGQARSKARIDVALQDFGSRVDVCVGVPRSQAVSHAGLLRLEGRQERTISWRRWPVGVLKVDAAVFAGTAGHGDAMLLEVGLERFVRAGRHVQRQVVEVVARRQRPLTLLAKSATPWVPRA
jgi:hypothetical protein